MKWALPTGTVRQDLSEPKKKQRSCAKKPAFTQKRIAGQFRIIGHCRSSNIRKWKYLIQRNICNTFGCQLSQGGKYRYPIERKSPGQPGLFFVYLHCQPSGQGFRFSSIGFLGTYSNRYPFLRFSPSSLERGQKTGFFARVLRFENTVVKMYPCECTVLFWFCSEIDRKTVQISGTPNQSPDSVIRVR